jgi:hypothetical protein
MKNKLLAVMATLGMVASASAVKVNNNLSINGFIDGSYVKIQNGDAGGDDSQSLGLDEVELNFNLNVGSVSGAIHIDNNNEQNRITKVTPSNLADGNASTGGVAVEDADSNELDIEQAYFTYNLNDAVSITFGRYGSALGFEREDPAGLYTYSRAYGGEKGGNFNLGNVDANAVEGITIAYSADAYSIAASFEEQAGKFTETEDLNLELSFTYTGIAGVNIGGGYFFDNSDGAAGETDALNIHASKQVGKLLLAAEYVQLDTTGSTTASDNRKNDGYMLLADYDHNDKLGLAVRLSNNENGTNVADYEALTIAPNYAVTDSLGVILEYTDFDGADTTDGAASEGESIAVELTYTF